MFIDPVKTLAACNIRASDAVADFGAGSGAYTRAASRIATTGTVFAVEVHQEMGHGLARALKSEGINNVQVLWGDIEVPTGSTLADHSVDFVIISNTLFQLEDRPGCAKEIHRVLKPGGRVLVVDWTESFGGMGPAPHHVFTPAMAHDLFERAGFARRAEDIPTGEHHYAILFHKA